MSWFPWQLIYSVKKKIHCYGAIDTFHSIHKACQHKYSTMNLSYPPPPNQVDFSCVCVFVFWGVRGVYRNHPLPQSVSIHISCKPNSSLTDLYNLKICMKEDNPCWKLSRDIIICARQSVSFVLWLTVLVSSNTKSENVNVLFKVKSTHFTLTTSLPE